MQLLKLENLVTVQHYARLCGIQSIAVNRRIYSGAIRPVKVSGIKFIDITVNPPVKRNPKGQRSPSHPYGIANAADAVGRNIALANLMPARKYARQVRVSTATVYHRIIIKEIEAIIIDDEIFIDTEKFPPEDFRQNRKPPRKGWEIRQERFGR